MYLHLGGDTLIQTKNIVGIFDLDNTSQSKITLKYLADAQKDKKVINVSFELPKAFVVCMEEQQEKVYISQIAASTIVKRIEALNWKNRGEN